MSMEAGYTVYKNHPTQRETTEWDDIQRRLGNLPPLEEVPAAPPMEASRDASQYEKNKEWLAQQGEEQLQALEDDGALADDRELDELRCVAKTCPHHTRLGCRRRRRLAELQQGARAPRFGTVEQIAGADFIPEVSNAGPDLWVLVHLFKEGHGACEVLGKCLDEFAAKYVEVKCVRIVSTECIKGYPDSNLPTLLVYRNTDVVHSYVTLKPFNGAHATPEDVERALQQLGVCANTEESSRDAKQAAIDSTRRMYSERIFQPERLESYGDSDLDSDFGDDD